MAKPDIPVRAVPFPAPWLDARGGPDGDTAPMAKATAGFLKNVLRNRATRQDLPGADDRGYPRGPPLPGGNSSEVPVFRGKLGWHGPCRKACGILDHVNRNTVHEMELPSILALSRQISLQQDMEAIAN
ncbi:MAG TPA: hypothetical protein VL966_17630, partial [Alphaproteobacteria bacterium]|nr:hypothetical protein [Alphaproteobacteria bacterium]